MTKGRNTTVIGIRLPDTQYFALKHFAEKRGISISDWLKPIITRALTPGKKEANQMNRTYPMCQCNDVTIPRSFTGICKKCGLNCFPY